MLDSLRRAHLLDALQDLLAVHHHDLAAADAAATTLLQRMGLVWRDVLVLPLNLDDPLPVRQAVVLGGSLWMARADAEPGWLVQGAVLSRPAARGDVPAMERLLDLVAVVRRRQEAHLATLRAAHEAGDSAKVNEICNARAWTLADEPPDWLGRYEGKPFPPLTSPPAVRGETTLLGDVIEGTR